MFDSLIQANSFVQVDYILKDEGGAMLDSSTMEGGQSIGYVHGYGMLVPGLESALHGMRAGEEKDIVVPPNDGYGAYDDELVFAIERAELPNPDTIEAGDEFIAQTEGDDTEVELRVLEVRDDEVIVDGNHPLAGKTLHYTIRVLSVRPATDAEIERAARAYDDARGAFGEGDGDEGGASSGLVQLGKRPRALN